MTRRLRIFRFCLIGLALVLCVQSGVLAGRTYFDPSVSLSGAYTDNVNFIDFSGSSVGGGANFAADTIIRAGVHLPVTRETRTGSFGFRYDAAYSTYNKNRDLSNLMHLVNFDFNTDFRRGGSLSLGGFYSRSQDQGIPRTIQDPELFLTARTNREFYGARIGYSKSLPRWNWGVTIRGGETRFDPIGDSSTDDPVPPDLDPSDLALIPEGRTYADTTFTVSRNVSRRASVGVDYRYRWIDLNRGGTETGHGLRATFGWTFSKSFALRLGVGGFTRERDLPDGVTTLDSTETGFVWILALDITPPIRAIQKGKVVLSFDVGVTPTAGGALEGTSTNSRAALYLTKGGRITWWKWGLGTLYTRRDSSFGEGPSYQTWGFDGWLEAYAGEWVAFRLGATWSDQTSSSSEVRPAAFTTVYGGLVWYPKGRPTSNPVISE